MKYIYLTVFVALAALTTFGQEVKQFKNDDEVPRITIEEAKKKFDDGTAVIVDARGSDSFETEHIKGAINIPNSSPDPNFDALPKGKTIILYCTWANEHSSASLALKMNKKGIPNVYALKAGFDAWKNANYPTEKGRKKWWIWTK